jgi:hypothetical protein
MVWEPDGDRLHIVERGKTFGMDLCTLKYSCSHPGIYGKRGTYSSLME